MIGVGLPALAEAELQEPDRDGRDARDGHAPARRGEARRRVGADREPRLGGARQAGSSAREAGVQQDGGAAAALCGEQQTPRRREPVVPGAPEFRQHGGGAEPQGFLQRPQRRLAVGGAHQDQPVRVDAVGGEARPIG